MMKWKDIHQIHPKHAAACCAVGLDDLAPIEDHTAGLVARIVVLFGKVEIHDNVNGKDDL